MWPSKELPRDWNQLSGKTHNDIQRRAPSLYSCNTASASSPACMHALVTFVDAMKKILSNRNK